MWMVFLDKIILTKILIGKSIKILMKNGKIQMIMKHLNVFPYSQWLVKGSRLKRGS